MAAWMATSGRAAAPTRLITAVLMLAAGLGFLVIAPQAALAASPPGTSLGAGQDHTCALENGKAYCWGNNPLGELGDGSTANSPVPVPVDTSGVLGGKTLTQITVGYSHTCALDSTGAAYCWGWDYNGALGDGKGGADTSAKSLVPVAVEAPGGVHFTQIAANGSQGTCALDSTGAAYCWGSNSLGELGDGSTTYSTVPVAVDTSGVLAGKTLTEITAGELHMCALDSLGAAYCWGYNEEGQLGDGNSGSGPTTAYSSVPVAVDTSGALVGETLTQITADGGVSTCAEDSIGAVYCWGDNEDGALGNGSTVNSSVPVAVDTSGALAGKTLTQITAHCALDSNGAAYCWGNNGAGQLGNGSTASSSVPVPVDASGVLAGKTLTQISGGAGQVCAQDSSRAVYCWGSNQFGQLGDNSTAPQSDVPVLAGPQSPTSVTVVLGDATATVSWTAPGSLDGGTLTGYTATAAPGGQTCATAGATACTITGLTNGTTYSVTVVAHTTVGDSGASVPATVTPGGGPAFTSNASEMAVAGKAFRFTVTTTGNPVPKITETGQLPRGVKFAGHSDGTATISGTPARTAAGTYPLTFTATSSAGNTTQAFTLTIASRPAIKKIPATTTRAGAPLHLAITATGNPPPVLTRTGTLPAGLAFTDNGNGTAAITGTPAACSGGRYRLTITAANPAGTTHQALTLIITQPPAITSMDTATARTGTAFNFPVTATGFPPPKITKAGRLPKGVSFHSVTATFTGTPRPGTSGTYPITIKARSTAGTTTQHFTLTIT